MVILDGQISAVSQSHVSLPSIISHTTSLTKTTHSTGGCPTKLKQDDAGPARVCPNCHNASVIVRLSSRLPVTHHPLMTFFSAHRLSRASPLCTHPFCETLVRTVRKSEDVVRVLLCTPLVSPHYPLPLSCSTADSLNTYIAHSAATVFGNAEYAVRPLPVSLQFPRIYSAGSHPHRPSCSCRMGSGAQQGLRTSDRWSRVRPSRSSRRVSSSPLVRTLPSRAEAWPTCQVPTTRVRTSAARVHAASPRDAVPARRTVPTARAVFTRVSTRAQIGVLTRFRRTCTSDFRLVGW